MEGEEGERVQSGQERPVGGDTETDREREREREEIRKENSDIVVHLRRNEKEKNEQIFFEHKKL